MSDQQDLSQGFKLVELRERPELAEQVAQINLRQWGDFTDLPLDRMRELFSPALTDGPLPVTFLVVDGDNVKGVVSLREVTLGAVSHPEAYLSGVGPWLSNMWIDESARGHKLATRLSLLVEERARSLGYATLFSSAAMENSLYHAMGFHTVGVKEHKGDPIYMISKTL